MRTLAVIVGLLAVTPPAVDRFILAPKDAPLSSAVLATSFGGSTAPGNGKCCINDPNCTVATDKCSNYNNQGSAACTGGSQITLQANYAPKCTAPQVANTAYDCTDYATDTTGKSRYCVAVFSCTYDSITKVCSSGAANVAASTVGTYSCASNCPPGTK